MKLIKLTLVLFACSYLWGCASGAKTENMVYLGEQKEYSNEIKDNLGLGEVSGGKKTNPAWTSQIDNESFSNALAESLKSQGLYAENGKYQLQVKMLKLKQPIIGLNFEVISHVQYILTDKDTGTVVLDETVVAPFTAGISDAFVGTERLRLANEGSARKSIEGLLNKLSELSIDTQKVSLAE